MSKLGKTPIQIPVGVEVKTEKNNITVKGSKGEIIVTKMECVDIKVNEKTLELTLNNETAENARAFWGLARSLVQNAVTGVSDGFTKTLELVGVGYRVEKQGEALRIMIGYSHPVVVKPKSGIKLDVEGNTVIKVSGINKDVVGQMAADIRAIRKPEPYKGKGIRYQGEVVRRKQGKSGK